MIRSDNPPDNGVSGAMYLFGTALLWSFIGIFVRANSQSALLIGAVTAIFMALFILLVGRPVLRVSRLIVLVAVCNFVTGTTFNFANQLTTVGNAIVLQYTSMIFVIVYQSLATRTLPRLRRLPPWWLLFLYRRSSYVREGSRSNAPDAGRGQADSY